MRSTVLIGLLIVIGTVAVFWQVTGNNFVNYDDEDYVTANGRVQAGLTEESIAWAFTSMHASNWHPLTWISHMLDWRIYGQNAMGHHLTSLLLHAANVLLLFLALCRMTKSVWRSAFVAALFGIHPLHVESVAWIAERKDVLSAFFWMLTMLAYTWYVERPSIARYLPVVLAFALGLMAKPMLVTLPFALLLLDYWPLGRFSSKGKKGGDVPWAGWKLIWEKMPLFVLSIASSVITFVVQRVTGAVSSIEVYSIGVRAANAIVAYVSYIGKMLWPRDLSVFYPYHADNLGLWKVLGAALLLAGISLFVIRVAGRKPYLTVGWLWYVGTLVPVVGLVQVGAQAMADRYTYIPIIGLFMMAAWGVPEIFFGGERARRSWYLAVPAVMVLLALMVCTWFQVGYWRNSITLSRHALASTTRNNVANNILGVALVEQGKIREGIPYISEAIRIKPRYADAYNNLGNAFLLQGKLDGAIAQYEKALRINPRNFNAHNNLGNALNSKGRFEEAVEHYNEALRINPNRAEAHSNLGNALNNLGKFQEAVVHCEDALRIRPNLADAHFNFGTALGGLDRMDEAIREYREAIRIKPDLAAAHQGLAAALFMKGNYSEAWREINQCQKYGLSPSPALVKALSEKMANPKE